MKLPDLYRQFFKIDKRIPDKVIWARIFTFAILIIVIIERADPGFDWIFGYNIGGLITQYGGAASHMAIRCAEFGIPAAIGCGEKIYSHVSGLNYIEIDCKNGKITEVIQ